jgi:Viral BACON domain
MRLFFMSVCVAGIAVSVAGAQQITRKEPASYSGTERSSRVQARPPGLRLGLRKPREFALAPLSEAEVSHLAEPGPRLKTGIRRTLAPHALASGSWETTSEGEHIWRLAIHSPASRGMRVEFDEFSVGEGNVWVHDGAQIAGPYTGRGLFDDGHFWSAAVFSGSIIVEYEPASDTPRELEPPFSIRAISHQSRTAADVAAGTRDPADFCELDANCYPDWQGSMSSVAQISYVDSGGEYLCSGSLLSTRDNSFKPYFLTAGHCINNEAAARTVQAYWTYQTPACGGAPPASRSTSLKSTLGGHLISSAAMADGDYSLVLLQDVPAGTTFAGWDIADPPFQTALTGIHHPSGSWKRISFGERVDDATNDVQGVSAPGDLFLQVKWDRGRVEHGSSGSPLFSAPGVIVGSLSYAEFLTDGTVCTINPSVAGYSRFSNTYANVKDYLENLPADLVTPAKAALNFTMANHAAPAAQTVQLVTQSTGQVAYKLRADASWIKLTAITGSLSAKAPATVSISLDPAQLSQPGDYSSTVTIFSGAAPPQFLRVTATVRVDQSNVVARITPNPVAQAGAQWSFQIRLADTAGASTRVTAMKFNGADYSSSIVNWFGTDRIPASGAIVAPLSGSGVFPHGDQYFEFWGVDDASGQSWYRVATVTFQ